MLPVPEWVPPLSFPDLSDAKEIAIDLETCDPNMESYGPGWPRNDGYIVGFALAVEGWSGYFPVRHEAGGNLDRGVVERFMRRVLQLDATKVMHNAAYDLGWLQASGFDVRGRIVDTMVAAALIDENRFSYALGSLGFDFVKEAKSEQGLKDAAKAFGVHPKRDLWRLPAMFVGEYAEQDAALTLKLWQQFKILIVSQELTHIFDLEMELFPVLMELTRKGIRFDRDRASRLIDDLRGREEQLRDELREACGNPIDIWAAASIARGFDHLGIEYPRTEKGAPSFTKSFLATHPHPICKKIVEAREFNKTHNTFLRPYIECSAVDGRIHPHINQIRSDEGGTVTGRLSMANPNLQQVPARHEIIGPMVRGLFLPEEGQLWAANDFSSQEPRLLVHYATRLGLSGAQEMADAYHKDPNTDFHQMVADLAGIKRKQAKTIGLGLMYGMGKAKLANSLELPLEEAEELMAKFHKNVPFLRGTIDAVMRKINNPASGGSIHTLLGRRCRFDLWEPTTWGLNKALPYEEAAAKYKETGIRRAMTYKGLNRLIQGSAADQTKKAMIELSKAGFRILLQVHDEIALSVNSVGEARAAADVMKNAVDLEVPSKVDVETGPSWGEAS